MKKLWVTARQKLKSTSRVSEQHLPRMHVVAVVVSVMMGWVTRCDQCKALLCFLAALASPPPRRLNPMI